MTDYKKQHYLPACYLKYFSGEAKHTRKSTIWRCDEKRMCAVSVDSQCHAIYHYTKNRRVESEQMFGEYEKLYSECVNKIKTGIPLGLKDELTLTLLMFHLNTRNAAYRNLTEREEVDAYAARTNALLQNLLLGRNNASQDEQLQHLERHWRLQIIRPTTGMIFITSDNPCVFLSLNPKMPSLDAAVLPLTPYHLAIAFDHRVITVPRTQATEHEGTELDLWQVKRSTHCVYTPGMVHETQLQWVRDEMKTRLSRGHTTESQWTLPMIRLFPERCPLFQLMPPLI